MTFNVAVVLSAYVTDPIIGSFTPELEKDSKNTGIENVILPLGKPADSVKSVTTSVADGIVTEAEELETNPLCKGIVLLFSSALYKAPVSNSIQA